MKKSGNDSVILRAVPYSRTGLESFMHHYHAVLNLNGNERALKNKSRRVVNEVGDVVLDCITALQTLNHSKELEVIMEGEFSRENKRRVKTAFDLYASSTKTKVGYSSRSIEKYLDERDRLAKEEEEKRAADRFCDRFI